MVKPSNKSPEVEQTLTKLFGFDRAATIAGNTCVPASLGCGKKVIPEVGNDKGMFKDALSLKEYSISGFCQQCQDGIFGGD